MKPPAVLMCDTEKGEAHTGTSVAACSQPLYKLSCRIHTHVAKTDAQSATRAAVELGINSLEKRVYNPNVVGL